MKRGALAILLALAPSVARADEPSPPEAKHDHPPADPPEFAPQSYLRVLAGMGNAANVPMDDQGPGTTLGLEIGHYPLRGALGTGFSVSWTTDTRGYWSVVTPGFFAALDLTYIFMSGLWTYKPEPPHFRMRLGGRLGLGISQSTRPASDVPYAPAYVLIRPELESYFDVEVPFSTEPTNSYSVFTRTGVDTGVNMGELFRWSFAVGLTYGFDGPEMQR